MNSWQDDLLSLTDGRHTQPEIFSKIQGAARAIGFEHCAYGMRMPVPWTRPRTVVIDDFPANEAVPEITPLCSDEKPLPGPDALVSMAKQLQRQASACGLRVGWVRSTVDAHGIASLLCLARRRHPLTPGELKRKEHGVRWVLTVAHMCMSSSQLVESTEGLRSSLTQREIEVLKWTADGKTAGDISDILSLSHDTINYHVKNAVAKLRCANKTAAVALAATLGLLT